MSLLKLFFACYKLGHGTWREKYLIGYGPLKFSLYLIFYSVFLNKIKFEGVMIENFTVRVCFLTSGPSVTK